MSIIIVIVCSMVERKLCFLWYGFIGNKMLLLELEIEIIFSIFLMNWDVLMFYVEWSYEYIVFYILYLVVKMLNI